MVPISTDDLDHCWDEECRFRYRDGLEKFPQEYPLWNKKKAAKLKFKTATRGNVSITVYKGDVLFSLGLDRCFQDK